MKPGKLFFELTARREAAKAQRKMQHLLLGAHMSIQGGLYRALERGGSIGCNTIQIFTRNSTRWASPDLDPEAITQFRQTRIQHRIDPVFAHCSYLINLAAGNEFYEQSIALLILEVQRAEQLGLSFVVLHPGAHMGCGETNGLMRTVDAINRVIDETAGAKCKIAIENTAGQGSCIGCELHHLGYIWAHVTNRNRIGFCIDTCHLFAAGYDIRTEKLYTETFLRMQDLIPPECVLAFHLNDSKKELGSRVDRHQHIGKGHIGSTAFRCLLNDERFTRVPKVLETPKGKDLAEDVMNLKILRSLARGHTT